MLLFLFLLSALLYLNGDFEGGEFIFTEMDAKTVTVRFLCFCPQINRQEQTLIMSYTFP